MCSFYAPQKRGNTPGTLAPHDDRIFYYAPLTPASVISHTQLVGGPKNWIKTVCTKTDKLWEKTDRSIIYISTYDFHGIKAFVIVKELKACWKKNEMDEEIKGLMKVGYFLGHGYNKRTGTHYIVMKFLGMPPSEFVSSNRATQLVKKARERYKKENALIRGPDSIQGDYCLMLSKDIDDYIARAPGSWRKALKASHPPTVHPQKEGLPNSYEEWYL
ncbi:hypothetical protein APHAL10511_002999 [Amanita phalloides]|nr:hypothetical protein APHAL10511_002999 [Amanita phalloides]